MSVTSATDVEPIARPAELSGHGKSLKRQSREDLEALMQAQNEVLGHIVGGSPLVDTLAKIAGTLEEQVAPAAGLLLWIDSDGRTPRHLCCGKLAAPLVEAIEATIVSQRASEGGLAGALAQLGPLCRRHRTTLSRRQVSSDTGELIAALVVLAPQGSGVGRIDQYALRTLALLVRFAVEADRRQLALSSANERLASIAKSIPGVVYQRIVKPDGDIRYTYISEAANEYFGVSPEEIVANPQALFDCHGPEYYATFRERLLKASHALELWDVEATIINRDGRQRYTHAIAKPHRLDDGSVVWDGVILDATRIKEAERVAAAAEAQTREAIMESVPHGFALFDRQGKLVTWNSRLLDLYPALSERLARQMTYADLVRAEIDCGIDTVAEGEDPEVRFHQRMLQRRQADTVMERQLADGRWILVNEHRTGDGGLVILHSDISELKTREAALRRSNQELETFASIASHDLQEPLRKIDAFGDRLKRRYHTELGDDGQLYIERMQSAVGRMRSLINDLLDYSRVTTKARPFVPVELGEVVHEVLGDLQVRLESTEGKVEVGDLPTLDAESSQMRQLFQNLIANALKFHREGVPPVVKIESRLLAKGRDRTAKDRRVEIKVSDNGIGFDMKYADRIFGMFQRLHTRAEYEGTGVGLATCRKIVDRHGGTITATSEPGHGTMFTIELPLAQPSGEAN